MGLKQTGLSGHKKLLRFYTSYVGLIALVVLGFVFTYQFVEPSPPNKLTIATGSQQGAYYRYAQAYAHLLERDGIKLDIIQTSGSVENISLLDKHTKQVDVAFVQGGIEADQQGLTSLGSMYYEPVWIFYRKGQRFVSLTDLQGRKVAIGPDGSGTQALARVLLARNDITEKTATLVVAKGAQSVIDLRAGKIDLMFMVASHQSPQVQMLLQDPDIELMDMERAEAYTRILPYLSVIKLPRGVIDFDTDIPDKNKQLLATTANLVAHPDLHPALTGLLMQAVAEVHGTHGLFNRAGKFPTADYIGFPLNKNAEHYYKYGPSFLQRYLPFWAANMIDRLKIMLLPVIALLIPFFKLMPPVYRWGVRRRIYHWYSELRLVDPALNAVTSENLKKFMVELDRIEEEVRQVEVPLSYADELFNLRLHLEMVRRKLKEEMEAGDALDQEQ